MRLVRAVGVVGGGDRQGQHEAEAAADAGCARDLELRLVQSGAGWHGRIEPRRAHAWNLRLMPADSSWRLVGRIEPDASQVELHPALRD